ncbi:unnamed protein product [Paramecium octaurelia]|uniref:Protein kinase domain-containing protein n=1 Tax=Paramecium octaurelia TaxID=43137 RepID=A0A8S1W752_PAROT|nr:unnamed protein product [Paramecium octaurelia]
MEQGKNTAQQLIAHTSLDLVKKFQLFKVYDQRSQGITCLGYFQRDLNLENFVYFQNKNKVKLIDFGLAKKYSTRLKTIQVGNFLFLFLVFCQYVQMELFLNCYRLQSQFFGYQFIQL